MFRSDFRIFIICLKRKGFKKKSPRSRFSQIESMTFIMDSSTEEP